MRFLFASSGCFLPFLIILNLFFGRIFLDTRSWLAFEGILLLLFVVNSYFSSRKIISQTQKQSNVIDIEGEVVDNKQKLP